MGRFKEMAIGGLDYQYQRNLATLRRCQLAHDNMLPPEYWEPYEPSDEPEYRTEAERRRNDPEYADSYEEHERRLR